MIEDGMMVVYLGWVGESEETIVQALKICDGLMHSRGWIREKEVRVCTMYCCESRT